MPTTSRRFNSGGSLATLSDVTIAGPIDGQVLTYDAGTLRWINDNPAGTGDVVGPAGATDNAVVRFNGATGTSIQNSGVLISDTNDLTLPGMASIGSSAQAGSVGGVMRFIDEAWTVTDFTTVNSWRIDNARFIVDPDADYTGDSASCRFSQISIPNTNANDFGTITAANALAQHFGSGTVTSQNGHVITSTLNGTGVIATNIVLGVSGVVNPGATGGSIGTNQVLVLQSGPTEPTATITLNESIRIRTPRPEGTTTTNRAIHIENQVGPGTSHAIYSAGGQSYHEGNFGFGTSNTAPTATVDVIGTGLFTVPDDTASVFSITQAANNYIAVNTNNTTESILFGNATTNPDYIFQGTGLAEFDGPVQIDGAFDHNGTTFGALGAAPALQQAGGAQTAGAAYTATEQGMLQTSYDALRTFGFLS